LGQATLFLNLISLYGNVLHDIDYKIHLFIRVSIISYSIIAIMSPDTNFLQNPMVDDTSKLFQLISLFDFGIVYWLLVTELRSFFYAVCTHPHAILVCIVMKNMIKAIVICFC